LQAGFMSSRLPHVVAGRDERWPHPSIFVINRRGALTTPKNADSCVII
jgi:hypothetical protein